MSNVNELPGRPREFDREAVLSQAMVVFWEWGFVKTTYAALEEATGLRRQSLVYAFGNKKSLFQMVLQHYAETKIQKVIKQLQADSSPLNNIRAVFALWLEDARRKSTPGCLFVNTSGELGQKEYTYRQIIEQSTQQLIEAFRQAIEIGQAKGEITARIDAADLAKQAVAVGDGSLLRSRADGDSAFAEAAFRGFLISIEVPN